MYYVSDISYSKPSISPKGVIELIEVRDTDSTEVELFTFEEIMLLILSGVSIKGAGLYYRYGDFISKLPSSVSSREMICIRNSIKHYILIDSYGDYKKTLSYSMRYGAKIVVGVDNSLLYLDLDKFSSKILDLSDIDVVDLSRLDIHGNDSVPMVAKMGENTKLILLPDSTYNARIHDFLYDTVFDLTNCSEDTLQGNIINICRYNKAKIDYKGDYTKFADIYFDFILSDLNRGIEDELYRKDPASYISCHFNNELHEVIKARVEKYVMDNSYYIDEVLNKSKANAVHSALSTVLSNKNHLKWLNLNAEFSSEKYSRDKFEFIFYTIALLNIMKSFKNISGYLNLCLYLGKYDIVINSVRKYCDAELPEWSYVKIKGDKVKGSIKDIVNFIYSNSRHSKAPKDSYEV